MTSNVAMSSSTDWVIVGGAAPLISAGAVKGAVVEASAAAVVMVCC